MSTDTQSTDVPPVSEHASDRWAERTDDTVPDPTTAWQHAQRVDVPRSVISADEVRIHHPTGTLLVCEGAVITTILTVDEASEAQYHAIKHALPETTTQ